MSKSKMKLMFIAFFDINGIVHMEFLPQGTTVNQLVYKEILRRLKSVIKGTHFPDFEAMRRAVKIKIWRIPEETFCGCIEGWKNKWKSVLDLEEITLKGKACYYNKIFMTSAPLLLRHLYKLWQLMVKYI